MLQIIGQLYTLSLSLSFSPLFVFKISGDRHWLWLVSDSDSSAQPYSLLGALQKPVMAAAAGACFFASGLPPSIRRHSYATPGALPPAVSFTRRLAVSTADQVSSAPAPNPAPADGSGQNGRLPKDGEPSESAPASPFMEDEDEGSEAEGKSLEDFFSLAKDLIGSDGGPPRWLSPLECASRLDNSPLLLYLPG